MRKAALALLLPILACSGNKDPKIPGDELGTYQVVATLDSSTCGPGALGSTDVWQFDVKLSRDGDYLYWLNGAEAISGAVAADGVTFAFDTQVVVQAVAPGKGQPGCAIARIDSGSGTLANDTLDVDSFNGRLRYGFQATQGSDCQSVLGVEGGFYSLPCEMSYLLAGKRKPE
jgi:hypothetical protein